MTDTITISKEAAEIINRWFLPTNPNKLRRPQAGEAAVQEARKACQEFKTALQKEG